MKNRASHHLNEVDALTRRVEKAVQQASHFNDDRLDQLWQSLVERLMLEKLRGESLLPEEEEVLRTQTAWGIVTPPKPQHTQATLDNRNAVDRLREEAPLASPSPDHFNLDAEVKRQSPPTVL
jgi:hypothetical protein